MLCCIAATELWRASWRGLIFGHCSDLGGKKNSKPMLNFRGAEYRSLGNALAVVAAILVVGLLSFLIYESRAVSTDYYLSQAQRTRAVDATQTEIAAAMTDMRAAFDAGSEVSPAIQSSFIRLRESNRVLQALENAPGRRGELRVPVESFDASLARWLANSEVFVDRQNALATALVELEETSPALVRQLRELGLSAQSQSAFSLALDSIEYATGQGVVDANSL